jgi:hypothetical protein
VFIEAMSDEQVALLADDIIAILAGRSHRSEVASEPP